MRFVSLDDDFYKLDDGTPSDCVYLALNSLFEGQKPDLVVSGINKGSNMGEDITYSGTAAGAMEAVLHGVPAIAVSQVYDNLRTHKLLQDFEVACSATVSLAKKILDGQFPLRDRRFLNVNIPDMTMEQYKGMVATRCGYRIYGNDAHMHRNPRGEEHYWLGLHPLQYLERDVEQKNFMSDFEAVGAGFVSVTPVKLDMTGYECLERLGGWL
jgi:5'-nucleotidase